jgi:mitosis inhibitor protein kinase SWE1
MQDLEGRTSPHTPSSSFASSVHGRGPSPDAGVDSLNLSVFKASTSVIPPVTPTAQRDHAFNFPGTSALLDVDTSITARFQNATTLAQGEFSVVYKVERPLNLSFLGDRLEPPPSPGKAWVVKKNKKVYAGMRDRQHKLREVEVLKDLKGLDHVLEYMDSWEASGHLFIQTEWCENGSLAEFLKTVGFKARVDDFRIWKILLELSLVSAQCKDDDNANNPRVFNLFTKQILCTWT